MSNQTNRKERVLLAKVGFDGHDRGIKIIAAVLREAGYEVIFLGKYLTVESVVRAAIDEDVDVIGLSFLGGAQIPYCREMTAAMKEHELDDVLFIVGGAIPHKDRSTLEEMGVDAVFPTNTLTGEIVQFLEANLKKKSPQE
jgi:methylmalonyl-CoA mutase C-terminal domain/subunit